MELSGRKGLALAHFFHCSWKKQMKSLLVFFCKMDDIFSVKRFPAVSGVWSAVCVLALQRLKEKAIKKVKRQINGRKMSIGEAGLRCDWQPCGCSSPEDSWHALSAQPGWSCRVRQSSTALPAGSGSWAGPSPSCPPDPPGRTQDRTWDLLGQTQTGPWSHGL